MGKNKTWLPHELLRKERKGTIKWRLGTSQTQAPGKKVGHQAVKMAPCVFSNYPVILVRVVLWTKVRANISTSCKLTHRNAVAKKFIKLNVAIGRGTSVFVEAADQCLVLILN